MNHTTRSLAKGVTFCAAFAVGSYAAHSVISPIEIDMGDEDVRTYWWTAAATDTIQVILEETYEYDANDSLREWSMALDVQSGDTVAIFQADSVPSELTLGPQIAMKSDPWNAVEVFLFLGAIFVFFTGLMSLFALGQLCYWLVLRRVYKILSTVSTYYD